MVVFRTKFAEKIFHLVGKNFREWQDQREKKFDILRIHKIFIKRKKKATATNATTNHDIREMFGAGKKKKKKRQNIIVID